MNLKNALIFISALGFAICAQAQTMLAEAEDFQFADGWAKSHVAENDNYTRQEVLYVKTGPVPNAMTAIDVKDGGVYTVWARSRDYASDNPKSRRFAVFVNDFQLPKNAGLHGKEGLWWEKLGDAEFSKGTNLIGIKLITNSARADALLFTKDASFDPNITPLITAKERSKIRISPIKSEIKRSAVYPVLSPLDAIKNAQSVSIQNGALKIIYTQKKSADGQILFERSESFFDGKNWTAPSPCKDEALILFYCPDPKLIYQKYYATWNSSKTDLYINIGGKDVYIQNSPDNPFLAGGGAAVFMRPQKVSQTGKRELLLEYPHDTKAKLTLDEKEPLAKFCVSKTADVKGYYSFALIGFNSEAKNEFENLELPTVYQNKRTMPWARMAPITLTSHPLALIETKENGLSVTRALIADPAKLPFEWPRHELSTYGFSLATPDGERVQLSIFSPILGGRNSFKEKGDIADAVFYILSMRGDWKDGLQFASEKLFAVSDLREPYGTSLSDAIANIAEYLKRQDASGWNKTLKGRWNIEGQNIVTQANPLAEISAAILTQDEELYRDVALPTFEYLLSREGAHFTDRLMEGHNYFGESCTNLSVPTKAYGADILEGANALLGGANAWMQDLYSADAIANAGSARQPAWTKLLGLYLAKPSEPLLNLVKEKADKWLEEIKTARDFNEPNMRDFINVSLYPYWWYLPDLYEITKDKKYLAAAEENAFYTFSSLWAYPNPPAGLVKIYQGNTVGAYGHNMWRGLIKEKLGLAVNNAAIDIVKKTDGEIDNRKVGAFFIYPEKEVEAKKVSRIGMGIEQHTTCVTTSNNLASILMSSWSPEMLKVSQYTGRDVLMKMSRHSIIGRYANFFGYYQRDFQDLTLDPQYPYKGPDLTCLYYHHAPCHFAAALDYLMAQIEFATQNAVKFPYVRQQGYVWFTDRIFGSAGKVFFDNNCRPLIDKRAVRADTPAVSVLLARAPDGLWAILLNDSGSEVETSVVFDGGARAMRGVKVGGLASLYDAQGKKIGELPFYGDKKVKLAPLGLAAIKIPAEDSALNVKPAILEGGHFVKKNAAKGWGDLHAFRIRSSFGDSLYIIASGGAKLKGAALTLTLDGEVIAKREYPFEISVYPISADTKADIKIELLEDGKTTSAFEASL